MLNSNLYNWVFNYNPYINKWCACKRDNYNNLFSKSSKDILKATDINVLIELINKTDGNVDKINKLLDDTRI